MCRTIMLTVMAIGLIFQAAIGANLLRQPESVAFDTLNNRYLVSNVAGADIIQIESDFITQSYYKTDLGEYCAGNYIVNDVFYVSVFPKYIKGYDLTTNQLVADLEISTGLSLDGITADTSGNLYVVDTQVGKIYKIRLSDYSITLFVQRLSLSPQDLAFDAANNRLLICYFQENAPVQAVSLPSGAVSTLVITTMGYFDGITHDGKGNTFLSSHANGGCVYRYDSTFTNPPELITALPTEPSGLDYNKRDDILAIPSFGANRVDFISFGDPDEDGIPDYRDNCPDDYNVGQEDGDGDGHGDVCDLCPGSNDVLDADGDGVPDGCDICHGFNDTIDTDGDTYPDGCDNCPQVFNPDQTLDADADGAGDQCDNCPDDYNPGQEDTNGNGIGDVCDYQCGNANSDEFINVADAVFLINYVFKGGLSPNPPEAGDANCDGWVNVADAVYLIGYVFKGGSEPCCP